MTRLYQYLPVPLPVTMGGTSATTSTGSGALVLATSPVLVTPNIGTPSAGVATNLTGTASALNIGGNAATASAAPISGVTGLGAGVATALAVNIGTAGSPIVNGGALGTPTSGVATNLTGTAAGLTAGIASAVAVGGITGLGTGVGTALAANTNSTGGLPVQIGPTSWTPTDASGATLAFTSVSAQYTKIGNIVFVYGTLQYPATVSSAQAIVGGLPFAVPNQTYAVLPGMLRTTAALTGPIISLIANTSTFNIYIEGVSAGVLNSTMGGNVLWFNFSYPVA